MTPLSTPISLYHLANPEYFWNPLVSGLTTIGTTHSLPSGPSLPTNHDMLFQQLCLAKPFIDPNQIIHSSIPPLDSSSGQSANASGSIPHSYPANSTLAYPDNRPSPPREMEIVAWVEDPGRYPTIIPLSPAQNVQGIFRSPEPNPVPYPGLCNAGLAPVEPRLTPQVRPKSCLPCRQRKIRVRYSLLPRNKKVFDILISLQCKRIGPAHCCERCTRREYPLHLSIQLRVTDYKPFEKCDVPGYCRSTEG